MQNNFSNFGDALEMLKLFLFILFKNQFANLIN